MWSRVQRVARYREEKNVEHETRHVIVGLDCTIVRCAGDDSDRRIRLVDVSVGRGCDDEVFGNQRG